MSDVADRISDHDDAEAARKQNVGYRNSVVFDTLAKAFENLIAKYNERHPQGRWFPNAVTITSDPILNSSGSSSSESALQVQKNIEPAASLKLTFPIMSGEMLVTIASKAEKMKDTITLNIVNDVPTYDFGGKRFSAEALADLLLEPVFSSDGTFGTTVSTKAGAKIGFV